MEWAFYLQLLSCWFMCGAIWLVQLLIYPGFHSVDPIHFKSVHSRHTFRISFVVGPAMLVELATALILVAQAPTPFWALNLVGVLALWALTQFVSVPLHNRLSSGMNLAVIDRLTITNWPRTILWTARAVLLAAAI